MPEAHRRQLLVGVAAAVLASMHCADMQAAAVGEDGAVQDKSMRAFRASQLTTGAVVPALSSAQYVAAIQRARPGAADMVDSFLEMSDYSGLSTSLVRKMLCSIDLAARACQAQLAMVNSPLFNESQHYTDFWVQVLPPFDDLRQSAFYIPWAVLAERGAEAALPCQQRFLAFLDSLKAFDATLQRAGRSDADDADVQQALSELFSRLDLVVDSVPS